VGNPKFISSDLDVFGIPAGMLVNSLAGDQENPDQEKEGCVFHGWWQSLGKV
jgi:hypothetical protein